MANVRHPLQRSPNTNLDKVRIGCSGWSYKDWDGVFYPKWLISSRSGHRG